MGDVISVVHRGDTGSSVRIVDYPLQPTLLTAVFLPNLDLVNKRSLTKHASKHRLFDSVRKWNANESWIPLGTDPILSDTGGAICIVFAYRIEIGGFVNVLS